MSHTRALVAAVLAAALIVPSVSLAQDAQEPLTVYSGRSESLVGPVIESFTEATGIEVEVKYADTAELAALLLEEGDRSPADIYFAQDAGALGAVAAAGLLAALPAAVLVSVPAGFSDVDGEWAGVSGRARTVAYTTVEELELPGSILDFTESRWSGRIGWAPANGSFQAFVTALRVIEGEDVARDWLEGILANEPVAYPTNTAAVEGIAAGEVDVAFVNHYYLLRLLAEHGQDYPVAQRFFGGGDPGALVNVAGDPKYGDELNRHSTLLDNWRVETRDVMPAERERDGWTRDGRPLPHNQPWYDRYIKAGGKSSFEKF